MADLLNVHPEVRTRWAALEQAVRRAGYRVTVTSGYRSIEHQRRLYAARQRGEAPYPVAPPGCSEHQYGLAVDAVMTLPRDWIQGWARWFGLVWAGAGDPVHFGVFTGPQWRALRSEFRLC